MKHFFQGLKPRPENRINFLIATLGPIAILVLLANTGFAPRNILAFVNTAAFTMTALLFVFASPSDAEAEEVLNSAIKQAVRKFGPHVTYDTQKKCSVKTLKTAMELDERIDVFTSSGELQIKHAGIAFCFYFVNAVNTRGDERKTVLEGVVAFAKSSRRSSARTQILPDIAEAILGADLSKSLRDGPFSNDGLSQIRLESGNFERFFRVLTSDPVEARAILTPVTQEKLVHFVETRKLIPAIVLGPQTATFHIPSINLGPVTAFQTPKAERVHATIALSIEAITSLILAIK